MGLGDYPLDGRILALWREGKNTNEISRALWWPEYDIAKRLPVILMKVRQDQEWDLDRTE